MDPSVDMALPGRDALWKQLQIWRKDLVQLGRNSKFLFFKPTKSSTLEIEAPGIEPVLRRLLEGRNRTWGFYMPELPSDGAEQAVPHPASNELVSNLADAKKIQKILRNLDRRATTDYTERGVWTLYLGVGMLRWIDPDSKEEGLSPAVLVPVTLHRDSPREPFHLRTTDDDIIINNPLLIKLDHDYGIQLDDLELDSVEDILDAINHLAEVTANTLSSSLEDSVVLTTFTFSKEAMYRDLVDNEPEVLDHSLIQAIGTGQARDQDFDFEPLHQDELDEKAPPEDLYTVLPADATQQQCVWAARQGHTFVMDGPPGTGKSQTIANIIASVIGSGKKVLFVSEKMAALEVVKKRLDQRGLGSFALELHSHKTRRKELAKILGEALDAVPRPPDRAGLPLDQLKSMRVDLNQYAQEMNVIRKDLGMSLHDGLGASSLLSDDPSAPFPQLSPSNFTESTHNRLQDATRRLGATWHVALDGDDRPWRGLKLESFGPREQRDVEARLSNANEALNHLVQLGDAAAAQMYVPSPTSEAKAAQLVELLKHLAEAPAVPTAWLTHPSIADRRARAQAIGTALESLVDAETSLDEWLGQQWKSLAQTSVFLAQLEQCVQEIDGTHLMDQNLDWVESQLTHTKVYLEFVQEAEALARSLASIASFDASHPSIELVSTCSRVIQICSQSRAPPRAWFEEADPDSMVTKVRTYQAMISQERELFDQIRTVFSEQILEADVVGLTLRFQQNHHGIGKLSGQYRKDKKAVALLAHTRKCSPEAIEALSHVARLKKLREERLLLRATKRAIFHPNWFPESCDEPVDCDELTQVFEKLRGLLDQIPVGQRTAILDGAQNVEPTLRDSSFSFLQHQDSIQPTVEAIATLLETEESTQIDALSNQAKGVAKTLMRLRAVLRAIRPYVGENPNANQLRTIADLVEQWTSAKDRYDDEAAQADLLQPLFADRSTDWNHMAAVLEWLDRALALSPIETVRQEWLAAPLASQGLKEALENWTASSRKVLDVFGESTRLAYEQELRLSLTHARAILAELTSTIDEIEEWVVYARARDEIHEIGLGSVLDHALQKGHGSDLVSDLVLRRYLDGWIEYAMDGEWAKKRPLTSRSQTDLIKRFRELDDQVATQSLANIIERCNANRPVTTVGAASIIRREATKKKRHMPIRRLMEQAHEVILGLKPCFMMSPLAVSQYIPSDMRFDLVVFDEASQVLPSDAVNCIYRGKQVIIAGDEKQLPPTSFFSTSTDLDDDYEEDQVEEFESVLTQAKSCPAIRSLPLQWHYRSRHEDLIAFSNYSFYGGNLITFPAATKNGPSVGVSFTHVPDGIYRRGGGRDNPREAAKVVAMILDHATKQREKSLGVVAFSEAQASCIENTLEAARRERPDLDAFFKEDRLDGFFVKNLENVQGDERARIIFSVGYARDETGKFAMSFGPLNREGGEKRLNVAITRATTRVDVVSSVVPSDFKQDTRARGARLLRRYLEFAQKGINSLGVAAESTGGSFDSPFEESVAQAITNQLGFEVEPQVGTAGYRIDLAILNPSTPNEYLLGIECDGAAYHSSKMARDRDRLREEVLTGLGWRIHRIWGPDWYRHRDACVREIEQAISEAMEQGPISLQRPKPLPQVVEFDAPEENPERTWTVPYEPYVHDEVINREMLGNDYYRTPVENLVRGVARKEGPVHRDVIAQRLAEAAGMRRTGALAVRAARDSLERLLLSGSVQADSDGFVRLGAPCLRMVRVPDPEDSRTARAAREVPVEEVLLALRNLVVEARMINEDELTKQAARVFGWHRRGADVSFLLSKALAQLKQAEDVANTEDGYRALA
jgi:very-short-patch-repair endonuclease